MVARDLTTGKATEPVPRKKNPDYDKKDGSPEYIPDEPHIGLSGVNDDPKPPTFQTGIVRGGTSNPPKGQSGDVERVELKAGEADALGNKFDNGDTKALAEQAKATEASTTNK